MPASHSSGVLRLDSYVTADFLNPITLLISGQPFDYSSRAYTSARAVFSREGYPP